MRHVLAALCATLALCACSQKEDSTSPAPAAAARAEPPEGTPRIAIAPDGVHVQYHVYGSAEPALVFIHGWSCDSNYWREQVPAFKSKFTVVTVDLAGHGGTDGNRSDWSIARFGQDVATAMAAVPSQKIILVGHSMGGPVAIEAARLLKDRVIGLIGVDTFRTIGSPPPPKPRVDAIVKPFEADFIGHTRELVTQHLFVPGSHTELATKVAYDMSLSPPRVAIPSLRALFEYDFTGPVKDIHVPVVAIDSDLGGPVNEVPILKVLPKFKLVMVPGAGHFLMLEDPQRFNALLGTEIQGILESQGS